MRDLRVTCKEGKCRMRLVCGFKNTEIVPPAVSDGTLEYLMLKKTSLYINFFNALFPF